MKCLIILILLFTLITESKAEIYRWIDENGQIHYSDESGNVPKNEDKRLEEIKRPTKPSISTIPVTTAFPKTYVPQIPGKTKEQQEKELNEQVRKSKEQSKKNIDEMFSVANEGLASIRNGLIVLFVSMISLQLLKKLIKQKSK